MDDQAAAKAEYGVTPTEMMSSMAGLDFVRAIFDGKLPAPPIMQTVEPFDSTAEPGVVVFHSTPGFRHYNPIGSVHGGYAATLLDSAMGLAVHSMLPPGTATPRWNSRSVLSGAWPGIPEWCAARAAFSMSAAAPPPPRRASPTPRAACWRTPPRPAWFSRYLRKLQREREPLTSVVSAPDL